MDEHARLTDEGGKLLGSGQFVAAAASFLKAHQLNPKAPAPLVGMGVALSALNRPSEAESLLRKAISLDPANAMAFDNLGIILRNKGDSAQATQCFERALSFDSGLIISHYNLGGLKRYSPGDPQIKQMESLHETATTNRAILCFALAKAYEDTGEIDSAVRLLHEGNALRAVETGYKLADAVAAAEQMKSFLSSPLAPAPPCAKTPIFIVGMPRSGTTLVEQILASHPEVSAGGEIPYMGGMCDRAVATQDRQCAPLIQRAYLQLIESHGLSRPVFTDKMPDNAMRIGIILAAFPNAKLVHVSRDPMATCWSIYKHYFSSSIGYAWRLEDIAGYYHLYRSMMDFWEDRYPGAILHIEYEALVAKQESETRRLLEYCGLPWSDTCLRFYETAGTVKTLSHTQVRKPIYQNSSDAWRVFDAHLAPLKALLRI